MLIDQVPILLIILFSLIISVFLIYFNEKENLNETNIETAKNIDSEIDKETGVEAPVRTDSWVMPGVTLSLDSGDARCFVM